MSFKLGYLLVSKGFASLDQIDRAFWRQQALGGSLDTNLLEMGVVDEQIIADQLIDATGLSSPPGDAMARPELDALGLLTPTIAIKDRICPISQIDGELVLVTGLPETPLKAKSLLQWH